MDWGRLFWVNLGGPGGEAGEEGFVCMWKLGGQLLRPLLTVGEAKEVLGLDQGEVDTELSGRWQKMATALSFFFPDSILWKFLKKYSVSWKNFTVNAPNPTLYILPWIVHCACLVTCPSVHLSFNSACLVPASVYRSLNISACVSLTAVQFHLVFSFGLKIYIQCNTDLHLLSLDTCIHLCKPALNEHHGDPRAPPNFLLLSSTQSTPLPRDSYRSNFFHTQYCLF